MKPAHAKHGLAHVALALTESSAGEHLGGVECALRAWSGEGRRHSRRSL
jgi:hypothetical protein